MVDLEEMRRVGNEATAGPWFAHCDRPGPGAAVMKPNTVRVLEHPNKHVFGKPICDPAETKLARVAANFDFVVWARNHWNELIEEIEQLRASVGRADGTC